MKKIALVFSLLMLAVTMSFANTSAYQVDDSAVDALFASATDVHITNVINPDNPLLNAPKVDFGTNSDKNAVTAFVLCWFIGYFGIHRMYMGTSTGTLVGYILTLGGCGIVVTIDWVVLLMAVLDKGDISKYIDNPKFFMW